MAYRLTTTETLPDGLRRTVAEELDAAAAALRPGEDKEWDKSVHSARKSLKKTRAALRLARPALGASYKEIDTDCRDAGRLISSVRDSAVLVHTLDTVLEANTELLGGEAYAGLRARLEAAHESELERWLADGDSPERAARAIEQIGEKVGDWPLADLDVDSVHDGLAKTYRRGRKAMAAAFSSGEDTAFHDWRKRVKDLGYEARLLREAWPSVISALAGELDALGDLLGEEHDITVLSALLADTDPSAVGLAPATVATLAEVASSQREQLRERARSLGARIYAEKPAAFAGRSASYLRAARAA